MLLVRLTRVPDREQRRHRAGEAMDLAARVSFAEAESTAAVEEDVRSLLAGLHELVHAEVDRYIVVDLTVSSFGDLHGLRAIDSLDAREPTVRGQRVRVRQSRAADRLRLLVARGTSL